MFNTGTLTFREFMMREPLPLATIQNAVLEFLRQRDDAVVFGAQAVEILAVWKELAAQEIQPENDMDEF